MEHDAGPAEGRAGQLEPAAGRAPARGSGTDVLILAAEPGADRLLRTTRYAGLPPAADPGARTPERLTLYLLRLLAGALLGGAAMLATTRWTRLDSGVVKDAFFGVLVALMTLIAATAGFYYGNERRGPG